MSVILLVVDGLH